jgi:tetratricopeptide (TPR) repeat protein
VTLSQPANKERLYNHPDVTNGYYYLALYHRGQNKYSEAITLLEVGITKTGGNAKIYYNLGLLYNMINQKDKSETTLVKGVERYPGDFDQLFAL